METSNYRIGGIEEEFSVDRLSDTGMELHLNFPPHKNTFLFDIEKDGEIEDYAKQFTYHTYITGNAKETLLSVICHFTIVLRHGLLCYDFQDLLIGYRNYNHIYGRIFDDEQLIEYVKGNDLKYKYIFIIFHFNEDYIKNNDMNYITKFYETLYKMDQMDNTYFYWQIAPQAKYLQDIEPTVRNILENKNVFIGMY